MGKQYEHLSVEGRAVIQVERGNNSSYRSIARRLGRNVSSIVREMKRNESACERGRRLGYEERTAAMAYRQRRQRSVRRRKLVEGHWLHQYVHDQLVYWRWSPQQIAARLRCMHPLQPDRHVSHATIYAAIYAYPRGSLKKALIEALRQEKPGRGRRRTTAARAGFVPEALRIVHRPETITERQLPGHWEGDFIKGATTVRRWALWSNARRDSWCYAGWPAAPRATR